MTLNRQGLRRVNSPNKSPRRHNSSLRKKALVKKISGEVQFGAASKANLKVVVRVRPLSQREEEREARDVVSVLDNHTLVFDPKEEEEGFFFKGAKQRCRDITKKQPLEKRFIFEEVFGGNATNQDVYEATAQPLVNTLLQGYNCSVFAYGATGAGKTFTMLGQPECPGITSLTLQELYRRLNDLKGQRLCEVAVSYLEVYNEMVRDLLGSGKSLALQEAGQQVMVPGLSLHKPSNAEELLQMLARGNNNRSQHATDANAESSRSHAVFQIFVRQQDLGAGKANVTISKLSMIDLAGSERGAATGFRGARFKEGSSINKSLLALGNCINALADGHRHIPYRNSKLTRLLKDSLGGNCCSVMIAAMSPASTSYEDTYNTLRYAERAKTIRTTVKSNVRNVNQHVSDYMKIIEDLKEEIIRLQDKEKQYKQKEDEWEAQSKGEKLKKVEHVSEEEAVAQRQLQDVSGELKALRQELLQLESAYRVTELKRHIWSNRLAKVRVVAFASCRLDKTINRCERTMNSLDTKLTQIAQHIDMVKTKVTSSQAKLQTAVDALTTFGVELGRTSEHSQDLLDKHQVTVMLRDNHQLGMHRQSLLEEALREQNTLEHLSHVLLTAVTDLYLEFRVKEQCCPRVQSIFQQVVEGLDECRIAWADQQGVLEEGNMETTGKQAKVSQLDANYLGCLPSLTTAIISPTVSVEPTTSFRKSSIMAAVSGPFLSRHQMAEESRSSFTPTSTNTTARPRPASPIPVPLESQPGKPGEERSHSQIIAPTSPVLSFQVVPSKAVQHETQPTENGDIIPATSPARPLNTTIDIPSASHPSSPTPKPLNTTFEMETTNPYSATTLTPVNINVNVPYASELSSITVSTPPLKLLTSTANIPSASKLSSISMPTTCTSGFPSASQLSTITIPTTLKSLTTTTTTTTTTNPPSASKLSSFTCPTIKHTTNTVATTDSCFSSTTNFYPTNTELTIATDTHPIRAAYSESKLHHISSVAHQFNPRNSTASLQVAPVYATTVPTTTTTSASVHHVARKLFEGKPAELNSTFSIAKEDTMEADDVLPVPDTAREPQSLFKGTVGSKAASAPTLLVQPESHPNVQAMTEKRLSKPLQLIRGLRGGMVSRRGVMNRTPHKPLVHPFTPGKAMAREGTMRRSVSTSSLVAPLSSTKQPPTTAQRKLKNMGSNLHRASSFLTKKMSNQENVPPQPGRQPVGLVARGASPSSHTRSPGRHLGKS